MLAHLREDIEAIDVRQVDVEEHEIRCRLLAQRNDDVVALERCPYVEALEREVRAYQFLQINIVVDHQDGRPPACLCVARASRAAGDAHEIAFAFKD